MMQAPFLSSCHIGIKHDIYFKGDRCIPNVFVDLINIFHYLPFYDSKRKPICMSVDLSLPTFKTVG